MRSSACDTRSRSCARRVLCWLAFPLASALGSTDSAASCPALFVGFPATIAESDFPRLFIIGYGSSPSRCGPERRTAAGQTWDLPVPVQGASAHARFFDGALRVLHAQPRSLVSVARLSRFGAAQVSDRRNMLFRASEPLIRFRP